MITAIVFSRNRAMQLDALLTSMDKFTPGVFEVRVSWKGDNEDFQKAYQTVQWEHPKVWLLKRANLLQDLFRLLESSRERVAMFTDDDVFYRPIAEDEMRIPEGYLCFSPRLGRNTTYCYPLDKKQHIGDLDFQYAWSIDGHVFRRDHLLTKLRSIGDFETPNELESKMQNGLDQESRASIQYLIAWQQHSSLVNIPHNVVQKQFPNRSAGQSYEELNTRFLNGERIDLEAMDFSDVRAAHQEIPYKFRQCQL